MSQPTLEVAIRHQIGSLRLDVAFQLSEPWTVLFAPSGAGKSTVLRVIAGLVRLDEGRVVCGDGTVLVDTATGVDVAPHRRGVRFVGQQARLFPHLTVRQNVAYGRGSEDETEVMELCQAMHLAEKMPSALSGGERQRVALARALAAMPARALLLDEPFSGLDIALRDKLVREVRDWVKKRNVAVVQVTHDVGEVFAAGAEVVRMAGGRVVAQGTPDVVLREEREWLMGRLGAQVLFGKEYQR